MTSGYALAGALYLIAFAFAWAIVAAAARGDEPTARGES